VLLTKKDLGRQVSHDRLVALDPKSPLLDVQSSLFPLSRAKVVIRENQPDANRRSMGECH